jgi:hypothetical protein
MAGHWTRLAARHPHPDDYDSHGHDKAKCAEQDPAPKA